MNANKKEIGNVDLAVIKSLSKISKELKSIGNHCDTRYSNYFAVIVDYIDKVKSVAVDILCEDVD